MDFRARGFSGEIREIPLRSVCLGGTEEAFEFSERIEGTPRGSGGEKKAALREAVDCDRADAQGRGRFLSGKRQFDRFCVRVLRCLHVTP